MIKFKSQNGDVQLSLAEVTMKHTVNGEKSLSGTILTNENVLDKIGPGWSLEFKKETYFITYAKPVDYGKGIQVEFDAVHEFFYKMGHSSVYTQLKDGSHAATVAPILINGTRKAKQLVR